MDCAEAACTTGWGMRGIDIDEGWEGGREGGEVWEGGREGGEVWEGGAG
jgi:hypothetical protein